ncbi:hypothetical protein VULLAG_LOCUS3821 [Vulpes lagopus]
MGEQGGPESAAAAFMSCVHSRSPVARLKEHKRGCITPESASRVRHARQSVLHLSLPHCLLWSLSDVSPAPPPRSVLPSPSSSSAEGPPTCSSGLGGGQEGASAQAKTWSRDGHGGSAGGEGACGLDASCWAWGTSGQFCGSDGDKACGWGIRSWSLALPGCLQVLRELGPMGMGVGPVLAK